MGLLVDGHWTDRGYDAAMTGGHFVRQESRFRNWITADGRAGPTGEGGFKAEPARYHLIVSLACPWAHRTLIFRKLKGLESVIGVTVVEPLMGAQGWEFTRKDPTLPDRLAGLARLPEVYVAADPRYNGRASVPVLWDNKRNTIVNNESAEIIRMLNAAFASHTRDRTDYYPAELRQEIDAINKLIYENINNGVYRAGFATTQAAYEEAFTALFSTLDRIEARLA